MTRAGGISGLLMVSINGTNNFAGYDGNGNVTCLINSAANSLTARYEYSPCGQLIRETSSLASTNPFRFSTKYWDEESGLVYYGSRYYSPAIGRWVSRDPSAENGGAHLYQFVYNSPVCNFDPDGKIGYPSTFKRIVALADAVIQIGAAAITGHTTTSVTQEMNKFEEALEKSNIKAVQANGGSGEPPEGGSSQNFPRSEEEYNEYHTRILGPSLLALQAIGMVVYIQSGQAEQDSASFVQDSVDYARSMRSGDSDWADLDAAMLAIDTTNLTGNNNFGLAVYGGLEYEETQ
jgi:RHS repeat-associated protein